MVPTFHIGLAKKPGSVWLSGNLQLPNGKPLTEIMRSGSCRNLHAKADHPMTVSEFYFYPKPS
jgi:hypothetical protein